MRPLTEEETQVFFEKLSKYIGDNIKCLIEREDGFYCFRLHRERVFYVSEKIMKQVSDDDARNKDAANIITELLLVGRARRPREPALPRHLLRQVHQDEKVPPPRDRPRLLGPVRESQDLAQVVGGAAVPLRAQRVQVRTGKDHGEHGQVPGTKLVKFETENSSQAPKLFRS
jgi:hypothetical protein